MKVYVIVDRRMGVIDKIFKNEEEAENYMYGFEKVYSLEEHEVIE
jgi:hypothetical protein